MKKAIIYVRGHNTEMQEVKCRLYAADKKYKVLYVTSDMDKVRNCDVVIIANYARLSRNMLESIKIRKELAARNIDIESIASPPSEEESAEFSRFIHNLGGDNNGREITNRMGDQRHSRRN